MDQSARLSSASRITESRRSISAETTVALVDARQGLSTFRMSALEHLAGSTLKWLHASMFWSVLGGGLGIFRKMCRFFLSLEACNSVRAK